MISVGLGLAAMYYTRLYKDPRGLRNNNPLNIVWDGVTEWKGQSGTDGRFITFESPEWGIRAAARILDSYRRRGVDTIEEIISTWAPAEDGNNVQAYIAHVVEQMGPAADAGTRPGNIVNGRRELVKAMIRHENGMQPYSNELVDTGLAMA